MNKLKNFTNLVLLIGILSTFGFSHQKGDWGSPEKGIIMAFHQPVGTVNKYQMVASGDQEMNAMGRQQKITVSSEAEITHKIGEIAENKISHELSYTAFSLSRDMGAGAAGIPTDVLLNKILIVETGKVGDKIDLKNIGEQPAMGQEPIPVSIGLTNLIPELSPKPVKINDTWTSRRTLNINYNGNKLENIRTFVYTFVGMEKKMGYDCMKIVGVAEHISLKGSINSESMNLEVKNTAKTTAFFAYKEGFFIEISSEESGDTTIDIPASSAVIDGTNTTKTTFTFVRS